MNRSYYLLLCAVLALGLTGSAEAQLQRDLRSGPDDPIVVTGSPLTREQVREQAVDYVRQVGVARGQLPAARWIDPVCPRVRGIAEPYAEMVEARMRAIAREAGIRTAGNRCDPNISVSFVGDAEALMNVIERRSSPLFREVPPEAREALINGDAPIRWWYLTDERTRDGLRRATFTIQTEGPPLVVEGSNHYNSSIISTQMNRAILGAGVVIDLDRVEGRMLETVAAYAAFVAFAEVRAGDPKPPGSILGMFGPEPEARGLTDWDMAFLRSLYRLQLDRPARRHRGTLVRDLVNAQTPN
jgi:hypothetical protein